MVPEEAALLRWVLCIVSCAAVALEAQDYVDNSGNRNRVANEPTGKLGDRLLGGRSRLTNKMEEELDGLHFPLGLGSLAVKSPSARRLILVQPSAAVVQRQPAEIQEQGPQPWMVQQQTGHGGHFVIQTEEKPDRSPEPNSSGKQESQPKAAVKFGPRVPLSAQSVDVRCAEKEVTAEVKRNFLGNGQRVTPSDLTLGGCAAASATDQALLFRSELHACGSTMTMTEASLVYAFSLVYVPTAIANTSIIKTNPVQVEVQCRYPRKLLVSSDGVQPTWKPHYVSELVEQELRFSLRLMTEDWQYERPSRLYMVGDMMHFEASVLGAHHTPLRVYVDRCVATLVPRADAQPSYHFISNHGCLSDANRGGRSYFKDRRREGALQFQLQAFRFQKDPWAMMFITCYLRATTVAMAIDAEHKACSFLIEANRWVASGGDNQVCSCCETTCSTQGRRRRRRRGGGGGSSSSQSSDADLEWEGEAALGPILVQEIPPEVVQALPDESGPDQSLVGSTPSPLVPEDPRLRLDDPLISSLVLCGVVLALFQMVLFAAILFRTPLCT